jgi:hypothetical protein
LKQTLKVHRFFQGQLDELDGALQFIATNHSNLLVPTVKQYFALMEKKMDDFNRDLLVFPLETFSRQNWKIILSYQI